MNSLIRAAKWFQETQIPKGVVDGSSGSPAVWFHGLIPRRFVKNSHHSNTGNSSISFPASFLNVCWSYSHINLFCPSACHVQPPPRSTFQLVSSDGVI